MWESTRWEIFRLLKFFGAKDLHGMQDLVSFPWESDDYESDDMPTLEEVEAMRQRLREENAAAAHNTEGDIHSNRSTT